MAPMAERTECVAIRRDEGAERVLFGPFPRPEDATAWIVDQSDGSWEVRPLHAPDPEFEDDYLFLRHDYGNWMVHARTPDEAVAEYRRHQDQPFRAAYRRVVTGQEHVRHEPPPVPGAGLVQILVAHEPYEPPDPDDPKGLPRLQAMLTAAHEQYVRETTPEERRREQEATPPPVEPPAHPPGFDEFQEKVEEQAQAWQSRRWPDKYPLDPPS